MLPPGGQVEDDGAPGGFNKHSIMTETFEVSGGGRVVCHSLLDVARSLVCAILFVHAIALHPV
jgi:hypothetical protein